MTKFSFLLFSVLFSTLCFAQNSDKAIYKSDAYSIYPDSVVQGKFVAKAVSDNQITSSYKSPSKVNFSANVKFKFTINGNIIEMKSGTDHHYFVKNDGDETPIITFGQELKEKSSDKSLLKPDTRLKIRLDMSPVFNDFKTKGYYVAYTGDTLFKKDFKNVYVGGETTPMTWNFAALYKIPELELKDDDKDGIYETTVNLNPSALPSWKLSKNISAFPQYKSAFPISNAIYNLSLEEMENAIEKDSTFRTGIDWPGVWTRDISYSIILSMAYLQPKVAMNSLLRKVNANGRIIQDTGTGGSYPVSTDRMIWATAAWEVYKVTGDINWLKKVYPIIKNSLEDDLSNIYDAKTGLYRGESSFLDWRNQTYPNWVQPVDIYSSLNLGTNAVHHNAQKVFIQMATRLYLEKDSMKYLYRRDSTKYSNFFTRLHSAVNQQFWLEDKGYHGQYMYGKNYLSLSPKSEALGEALCIYFDILDTERAKTVVANTPVTTFGIPCIYPQIPDMYPYHNNAVWPFVQSYWALASAKAGNEKSVLESISAIYRPAAMFLTNKENFVADNGDFSGTAINSSNMLWSLSGNISLVHKVFFGIEFKTNSLLFHPFVPKAFADTRTLTNFKYRNAVLDITMVGYGKVRFILLDNNLVPDNEIPANLEGKHTVNIVLTNTDFPNDKINKVSNDIAPQIPLLTYAKGILKWSKTKTAAQYKLLRNGKTLSITNKLSLSVKNDSTYSEYQVIAIDAKKHESFASEPIVVPYKKVLIFELGDDTTATLKNVKGYTGKGFVEISKTKNTTVTLPINIDTAGFFVIDFKYANGNGELGQNNKAAIRTLLIDEKTAGSIVFPQRGDKLWSNWGFSNATKYYFYKGQHTIEVIFRPKNENMNINVNQALLDYMRLSRVN
ncbi:MAG: glycogen debranching protein [Sphingobacteriales bacterium]|nr:MAG: glycogen debranching protein [Sphingobacteriales bacterium]TAF82710.1 MAG: glycogen debranching protein [Sphingobacteriales bacterium]